MKTLTGVFLLIGGRETPPAQVAQCQDHLQHKYRSRMQQLTLLVYFIPSTSANTPLALMVYSHHPLQLALVVLFLGALYNT